jgi:hypothetical protein
MRGRGFGVAYIVTVARLGSAWWLGGVKPATVVGMLAVLEIAPSFDNAVVNATALRQSAFSRCCCWSRSAGTSRTGSPPWPAPQ